MHQDVLELTAFHLTGKRSGRDAGGVGGPDLRPALFAGYMDLSKLRYDYPLVLVEGDPGGPLVLSLSGIVDGILQDKAPKGIEGERLRKHVLRLEEEMRTLAARGDGGSLLRLWDRAENNLLSESGEDDAGQTALKESLGIAHGALRIDGEVLDCEGGSTATLLTHVWAAIQEAKARRFLARAGELMLKLSDILKADFMRSDKALSPASLKGSVGTAFEAEFDFEAMSGVLTDASSKGSLPASRRRRIRSALSALESQKFFTVPGQDGAKASRDGPYSFVFDSCAKALEALRSRLPELVELIKAISVAELEIENRYREPKHDSFFDRFDAGFLTADDLDLFPSYLVCLDGVDHEAAEHAALVEAVSSGLPLKVLAQTDDVLGESPVGNGRYSLRPGSPRLASMAVGLTDAFVLQSSASHLYQQRDRIVRGLTYRGAALFSVYSGASGNAPAVPPYLMSAAAMQSRAFPTFAYDPDAGADWAARFHVSDNPQPDADWPTRTFPYEDQDLQRMSEDVAFTFVDFAAGDKRYARYFMAAPRSTWHEGMIPVREYLERPIDGAEESIPYVLMVDSNNVVHRAIVEDKLIDAARRCSEVWHSLQELGGINNSHARRLLDQEREVWEREKEREFAELKGRPEQETAAPTIEETPAAAQETAPGEAAGAETAPSDDPYIETPRCTTCNECTEINNEMFAYNENKQAYIADADAGTYRQMVDAAENCQVAIIHPGKPRRPDEPNLDELIKRAEPFM